MNVITTRKKIGAVLVQGGGIAGTQASLDLANSGYKVYLLDCSSAIGGMMSQLDKTFPTGDCATCIGSPKFVECANNLNIEIMTLSELEAIEGEPGNFIISVKRHPRFVNEDKCNGCSECTQACPVDIPNVFDRRLGTRKAIAKLYPQATPNIFSIFKKGHAPCKGACPAHINVQGYVQLIKKKEYIKAVNLIRERNPLSAICGRVCDHPCESECTRQNLDSSVAIRLLKKFASDKEIELIESGEVTMPEKKKPGPGAKKVAIIGAGPAGLTAAGDLADRGFAVTVFDALSQAGGMLKWGIPEYRLPKNILSHEVTLIENKGVDFIFNCRIGTDKPFDELQKEFDAIFISIGAQKSRRLGIDGEEKQGITHGLEFLRQAGQKGKAPEVKSKVVVIGGGNVAVDVARTALRLGAKKVEMVTLEGADEMPAYPEEIKATLEEGIKIKNGWGPKCFLGDDTVFGIELKRCTSVFDDDGRFNPTYAVNTTTTIEADQIIVAIGQAVDRENIAPKEQGLFQTDKTTLQTPIEGVFAGGDCVTGPASVIDAVASGKRAADSIERYLNGEDLLAERFEDTINIVPEDELPSVSGMEKIERVVPKEPAVDKRITSFEEVEGCFSEEAAIAEAERCLNCALCSECGECVSACEQKAIDHFMPARTEKLEVGSVILTPGFEEFRAQKKGEYGYGRYKNVVTSVEFERLLSAAGPTQGHVLRRSDGKEAKRIAWIQCVGSRDKNCGNDYCSSICCMASTKQALVANEHVDGFEATIFYMDIRAFGKGFDQYYERANALDNVSYIKSIPSRIVQMPSTDNLRMGYVYNGKGYHEQEFDLVVLSVGMDPKTSISESISRLGIKLNEFGFCETDRLAPLQTSLPGVYVAGAFQEPKDIPETVMQASGAASMSMELLASSRNTMITTKEYPLEHDVTDEVPRIGVFVCHCGMNIASVVDVEKVTKEIADLPEVVMATHTMFTCSNSSLAEIKETIIEHRLNRVVVASCTPRTHEPLFRETLKEVGLNPYLFELANIRDQCSWVHSATPEEATGKAVDLVKISIARAKYLLPLTGESIAIHQNALVIGGGISGITAALSIADQGFTVDLVERSDKLLGNLANVHYTLEHENLDSFKSELLERVNNNKNLRVRLETEVTALAGNIGNFTIELSHNNTKTDKVYGAIVVATGALPAKTTEYSYGTASNVVSQTELEAELHNDTPVEPRQNVIMIQCVGSRNDDTPYCSRLCCSMAIKNALVIKKGDPSTNVFVLYRDIRTYGFRETYYKEARQAGVVFIHYDKTNPPTTTESDGKVQRISVKSPDFPDTIEIETDRLVLSTGIQAEKGNPALSNMLKVPLNSDGFYVEAHLKLRPVDFATEGIYLCGLAHSPKCIDENISQAKAAAARAATVLSKTHQDVGAQVSRVDQDRCISCMTCVKACPYGAPTFNMDHKAEIAGVKCMGCGICVSECPAMAIQLNHFRTDHFDTMISELTLPTNFEITTNEADYE